MMVTSAREFVDYESKDNRELEVAWLATKHKNLGAGGVIGAILEAGGNAKEAIGELEANQAVLSRIHAIVNARIAHREQWLPFLKANACELGGAILGSGALITATSYDSAQSAEDKGTSTKTIVLNLIKGIGFVTFAWFAGKVAIKKAELNAEKEALDRLNAIVEADLEAATTMTRVFSAYRGKAESPREIHALARATRQLPPTVRLQFEPYALGALMRQPLAQQWMVPDPSLILRTKTEPGPKFFRQLREGVHEIHETDRVRCIGPAEDSGDAMESKPDFVKELKTPKLSAADLSRMMADEDEDDEDEASVDLDATLRTLAARQASGDEVQSSIGSNIEPEPYSPDTLDEDEIVIKAAGGK